jgi:hypothetical protein
LDFSVSASAYDLVIGTCSGGDYIFNMPDVGFDWDGTECSGFWRLSGFYTNGFDFYVTDPAPGNPDRVAFSVDYFEIDYDETTVFLLEYQTPVLTPEMTVTDNDNSSLGAVKMLYR